MKQIYLVARRDYLAYVGAWGFWLSLITAPVLLTVLLFGPLLLARAEPPRVIVVLADSPADAALVWRTFDDEARSAARGEVAAYLNTTARGAETQALAAFDAAPRRRAAIAAAREAVRANAPQALGAFPNPSPRYVLVDPPAPDIEGLRPFLSGARELLVHGALRPLYGAVRIRRDAGAPSIEYWSVNLSRSEPSEIASRAMRRAMRREALAERGVDAAQSDALDALWPAVAQYDPRPSAPTGEVTLRQKAPFYAALLLTFVLWSVVFSVANMLLSGVIEEKSNKILDTLLTSVTPLEILIGKLLGVAAVSITLFSVWGLMGAGLVHLAGERASDGVIGQIGAAFLEPRLLVAFGLGFLTGYLLYGAIFLALGSLCESVQEAQTLLGPVALVLAMPMMLIAPAIDNPNAPIIVGASWFPLFTPFLLLVRAPSGA
ncbi:MAG: ABC transporter permease [Terricaulis sp.]